MKQSRPKQNNWQKVLGKIAIIICFVVFSSFFSIAGATGVPFATDALAENENAVMEEEQAGPVNNAQEGVVQQIPQEDGPGTETEEGADLPDALEPAEPSEPTAPPEPTEPLTPGDVPEPTEDGTQDIPSDLPTEDEEDWELPDTPYMPYAPLNGALGSDAEPAHRKFIQANANGTYSLSLEVTGARQEVSYPADVVVIFDVSGSTTAAMLASFKLAAQTLADALLTSGNAALPASQQTRMVIVTFSTTAKIHGNFTASRSEFQQYINTIGSHAGETRTNWACSLEYANTLLEQCAVARPSTRKYTLFLTDGVSNEPYTEEYRNYVDAEIQAKAMLQNGTTLYTLGVLDRNNQGSVLMPYIRLNAGEGAAFTVNDLSYYSGWEIATNALTIRTYRFAGRADEAEGKYFIINKETEQTYIDAFYQIAQDINGATVYTHITIKDVLSDYVTLLNPVNSSGQMLNHTLVKISGGVTTSFTGASSVTYNSQNRTVTFAINETLEHQVTYRLTFTIAPSQKAFDELAANRQAGVNYATSGYPHTGGGGTGASSAARYGFFSNNSASLTFYTLDAQGGMSQLQTATPFAKPVVQLSLGTIQAQKVWLNDDASSRPSSIQVVLLQDGKQYRTATLNSSNGWAVSFNNIPSGPSGHIYTISEIDAPAGYEVTYAPASASHVGLQANNSSFTITNTRMGASFKFVKTNDNWQSLPGAAFDLYRWGGIGVPAQENHYVNAENTVAGAWVKVNGTPIASAANGETELVFSQPGFYQLVETVSPNGYLKPDVQWRFVLDSKFTLSDPITIPKDDDVFFLPGFKKVSEPGGDVWKLRNDPQVTLEFYKISSAYYQNGQLTAHPLPGAEFKLYLWMDGVAPPPDALVDETSLAYGVWMPMDAEISQNGGLVSLAWASVGSGVYYQLVETRAPDGFQRPTGQWRFSTTPQGTLDVGSVQRIPGADGAMPPLLTVKADGPFIGELVLENIPEYTLPSMGGVGKWPYVITGTSLLVTALSLYGFMQMHYKKRKKSMRRRRHLCR